eukprot:scaffold79608_cov57-Phaeocystis_antarctica.AAC.2
MNLYSSRETFSRSSTPKYTPPAVLRRPEPSFLSIPPAASSRRVCSRSCDAAAMPIVSVARRSLAIAATSLSAVAARNTNNSTATSRRLSSICSHTCLRHACATTASVATRRASALVASRWVSSDSMSRSTSTASRMRLRSSSWRRSSCSDSTMAS